MKKYLLLLLIFMSIFEYAMQRNARPLVTAARNRERQRERQLPQPPVRQLVIYRLINGRWRGQVHIKKLKEETREQQPTPKGPLLKYLDLEKKVRVKRDKPWTKRVAQVDAQEAYDDWCDHYSMRSCASDTENDD